MLSRRPSKPRLRVDPTALPSGHGPPSSYANHAATVAAYPHTSVFRSLHMEMHLHSPSTKVIRHQDQTASRSIPIYGDRDRIEGSVILDSKLSSTSGQLKISVEGAFKYEPAEGSSSASPSGKHVHVFYSATTSPSFDNQDAVSTPISASIRDAFHSMRKKTSVTNLKASIKKENFCFEIPRPTFAGEEMPPSFSYSSPVEGGIRGRGSVEVAEVSYRVTALWESSDGSDNRVLLEVPILFQPDTDFHSLDGIQQDPEAWLEVPLRSDRPINFQCAVTMPNPATFPRSASVPFFVVYTTTPKSALLSREIASDATIAVSLVREVALRRAPPPRIRTLSQQHHHRTRKLSSSTSSSGTQSSGSLSTPPPYGGPIARMSSFNESSDEDSDAQVLSVPGRSRSRSILRRVARSAPGTPGVKTPTPERMPVLDIRPVPIPRERERPLPPLPGEQEQSGPPAQLRNVFSEERTMQTDLCVGFPKRPRGPVGLQTPEDQSTLPDGLYKGRLQLNKNMVPSIDWAGLHVKYYLDVSVLFGQDELRARVPVRIF